MLHSSISQLQTEGFSLTGPVGDRGLTQRSRTGKPNRNDNNRRELVVLARSLECSASHTSLRARISMSREA